MKRHDTHLLSDSEEEEQICSEKHKYSFNNSKVSVNNSENNSLYSNNSKKDSPFKINNLKQNIGLNNKENINNNDYLTNISIISSKELENIFFEENANFSIISKNKKELKNEKKEIKNEELNNKKKLSEKDIKEKIAINNQQEKKSEKNKQKEESEKNILKNTKEENVSENKEEGNKSKNNMKEENESKNNEENENSEEIKDEKESRNKEENEKSQKIKDEKELKNNIKEKESIAQNENKEKVSNKDNENINKLINIKPKIENNKIIENIKIKLVKFNNNENNNELLIHFYTYTNSLKNKIKINERKCLSLNNSLYNNNKKKNRRNKNKINNIKYSIKSNKKKKSKILSKYNYNNNSSCNNDLDEDDKNIKNLIDIINKKKIRALKICKNSFSIKKKIINPILLDEHQKYINNNDYKTKKVDALKIKHKIQHQNDFYLKKANKLHNIKRIKYFPSSKIQINGRKRFQYIQKENKLKDNYYSSSNLISSNNSRYNNSNKNINFISTMNKFNNSKILNKNAKLKMKNDKKIKILYDLYCRKPEDYKKNMPRIKSAFSVNENNHKKEIYDKIYEYNAYKKQEYLNDNKFYNDKKNWLFRLIKLKKAKNMYHYDKHFGNSESCPLCQEMDKKNEESIKKKGIRSIIQEKKKNESKVSLPNRRIYSAYSKIYTKKNGNESSKSDINIENNNDINRSKIMNINISGLNNILNKDKNIKFNKMLKLKLNKVNYKEYIFQNSTNNNF